MASSGANGGRCMSSSESSINQAVSVAGRAVLTVTADKRCCSHFLFLFVSHVGESKLYIQFDGKLSPILTDREWVPKFSI